MESSNPTIPAIISDWDCNSDWKKQEKTKFNTRMISITITEVYNVLKYMNYWYSNLIYKFIITRDKADWL